jgi:branched-subunit amino acid transport protein
VSAGLVPLAVLMWAVTYPSRAVPLLAAKVDRLPPAVLAYLRLVGPSVLSALAVVNAVIESRTGHGRVLHFGADALGVAICVVLVAWRRNLFIGLSTAVILVALSRALSLG